MTGLYHALLAATLLVGLLGMAAAYASSRDPFHPLVIACPIALFFYFYMPILLEKEGVLTWYVTPAGLEFAQGVFLAFFIAFCVGALLGSGHARWSPANRVHPMSPVAGERMFACGFWIGMVGVGVWLLLIIAGGGLQEVYGVRYGGGELHPSGWVRETNNLYLVGLVLCLASGALLRERHRYLVAALLATPHIVHAILGARRGPTFVTAVLLYIGWNVFRNRRPALLTSLVGGGALGLLMIFLVGNRDYIYVGSQERLQTDLSQTYVFRFGPGNEYVVGSGLVVTADRRQQFGWGLSIIEQLLLRPIPKEFLPNKYDILQKSNVTGADIATTIGWIAAEGSAATLFAQIFTEFGWWGMLPCLLVGWSYGWGWRRSILTPSVGWQVLYVLLAQGLLHLLAQDFWAMAVPFLLMFVPAWLGLQWAVERPFRPYPAGAVAVLPPTRRAGPAVPPAQPIVVRRSGDGSA
jgi:hypothetical protein